MSDIQLLATVPIFSHLSSPVLSRLVSRMTRRSYGRNDMILMEHEFGDTFFVISSGSVKITHLSEDGREVIFAILGKGEFFGEMALFEEEPRSANAVALEETDVFILRRGEFLAFIEEYPQIVISLITEMARRIRRSDLQIEGLSLSDAEQRIGMTVYRLAEEQGTIHGGIVQIPKLPYQQEIANMAGTSRSTVSRTIKSLEERGIISRSGRKLMILDFTGFSRRFGKPQPAGARVSRHQRR